MINLYKCRSKIGLSQRSMASLAKLSFRTIQLIESGTHDPKISTLNNIAAALGYPSDIIDKQLNLIFTQPKDSVFIISERIINDGEDSWKIWLFNFVDAFRKTKDAAYIETPPCYNLPEKIVALIAGTVETLCDELKITSPMWCKNILPLGKPWFVAGVESLKAISIVESPVHFKKRNIFVLGNFLSRR